jgi:photosystem II stability/assembly factor-like uncharacterized protein
MKTNNSVFFFLILYLIFCFTGNVNSQWIHFNGPNGGQVLTVISCNNNIIAGTKNGLRVSSNFGVSWSSSYLPYTFFGALAVQDTVIFTVATSANLYRSFNYGQSWSSCNSGINSSGTLCLTSGGGKMFAGTVNTMVNNGGVYISGNYGSSWTQAGLTTSSIYKMTHCGNYAIAGTATSLYYSSGPNYTTWNFIGGYDSIYCLASGTSSVFLCTKSGIYRSTNNGLYPYNLLMTGNFKSAAVNGNTVFASNTSGTTFYSTNNGDNWSTVTGLQGINITSLAFSGSNIIAGSAVYGVYISANNGLIWENIGLSDMNISSFSKSTNYIFASSVQPVFGNGGGIYRSSDNGANWRSVPGINFTNIKTIAASNNYVFAGSNYDGIKRSTDEGNTWTVSGNGGNIGMINKIDFSGNIIYAATDNGLYRSADFGENWYLIRSGEAVNSIFSVNNFIFYGAGTYGKIYRSSDNGNTWDSLFRTTKKITSFVFKDSLLFASTLSNGLYKSTNYGLNWTSSNSGLPGSDIMCLYSFQNILYSATYGGFYYSSNNGALWLQKNDGFIENKLDAVYVNENYIFAGTSNYGIYRRPVSEISNIQTENEFFPDKYILLQNYPNPFNPGTNIKYYAPNSGNIKIDVFDISGKQIKILVNGFKKQGYHYTDFKPSSDLPSGIYFIRMTAKNFSSTRKMIFMK